MVEVEVIKKEKNPDILVITPLLTGHKISKETKKSIKRNDLSFEWIASRGDNNIPTNVWEGLNEYKKIKNLPKYYIMIDNDILLGRHMLDRLYSKIKKSKEDVAFAYASFQYVGHIHHNFPAAEYDIERLIKHNYISSNSMFKTDVVLNVGLVTDDKYVRLLDWAFILKLFANGYRGIATPEANFIVMAGEDDISARSKYDYDLKRKRVIEDFVLPLLPERFKESREKLEKIFS